jgi:hypothetical protein
VYAADIAIPEMARVRTTAIVFTVNLPMFLVTKAISTSENCERGYS